MTYKEGLFFIGKCLSLGCYPERVDDVKERINLNHVKWELIVWICTHQFVFPSLHLQLKRAGLLPVLPPELVDHMEEFTAINSSRNQQIMLQAQEISEVLNQHGIAPIYLKGTAHLLDGLYENSGERMVGDIDFLVDENDMVRATEILMTTGYRPQTLHDRRNHQKIKHYPRMVNPDRLAAVEIHRHIIRFPHNRGLNSESIIAESRPINLPTKTYVLSDKHQIIHNVIDAQVNDEGYLYGKIFLSQSYDLFLLSRRGNPLTAVKNFNKFFHRLNANLALTNLLFCDRACIPYRPTLQSKLFIDRVLRNVNSKRWSNSA